MVEQVQGYRLSPQEKRIWQLQQNDSAYYGQCAILIEGRLNLASLTEALNRIINKHEILRTVFRRIPGTRVPLQDVADGASVSLDQTVLTDNGDRDRENAIDEILRQEGRTAGDIEQGSLMRTRVVQLSEESHLLIITLPSLCCDARTLSNLFVELCQSYEAQGPHDDGSEEVVQYLQFSEWQNELLNEPSEMGEYWRRKNSEAGAELTLPFEARVANDSSLNPDSVSIPIDAQQVINLNNLARRLEVADSCILLACWQTLLWRLTGQKEIVVGAEFDGRKYEEMHEALGPFSKWAPVHARFENQITFGEVLGQITNEMEETFASLEYFTPEGGLDKGFAAGFEYWQELAPREAEGLVFSLYRLSSCIERYKIKLRCVRSGQDLKAELHFNRAVVQSGSVRKMAEQYSTLLAAALDNPEKQAARLNTLSPQQRHEVLVTLNDTRTEYDRACFHQMFEEQVRKTPEAVAIEIGGKEVTYGELNREANRLGRFLRGKGVRRESVVGIMLERGIEQVVALLGVMKAGGAYLPIDGSQPKARVEFMVEDSNAEVVITREEMDDRIGEKVKRVYVDRQAEEISRESWEEIGEDIEGENLAYVIYTSGTTGKPKGVMVTHGGLSNYLRWSREAYEVRGGQGSLVHSPIGFDLTVTSLYLPLLEGKRAVLIREEEGIEGLSRAMMEEREYTLVKITPSHLDVMRQRLEGEQIRAKVKAMVIGGEALTQERVRFWQERSEGTRVINEYGPTETVVGCSVYEMNGEERGGVPIGRPIANTQIYVLNDEKEVVGIGEEGEIYIGGEGLARGYLNRADITAERFEPNPYSELGGGRMYRTGDIGRYGWGGELEYKGRNDGQVKIRGHRVEIGEIEEVMREEEGVREVAVVVRGEGEDKRVVGYVVVKEVGMGRDLRERMREKLPEYMVPAQIVEIEEMPLTENGKIDKSALPSPERARPELGQDYVPPQTFVEEVLVAIWSDVLGIDRIGIHDSFFALGGDSIRSVQVVALSKERGLMFSVEDLFQHQTIAELAIEIESAHQKRFPVARTEPFSLISAEDRLKIPDDVEDAYPLTMLQGGMLYHLESTPDSPAYHNINSYHLRARFDEKKFNAAAQAVVSRHPVLRTSFDFTSYSEPLQLVHRKALISLDVEDLRHVSHEEQNQAIAEYVEMERFRIFDLTKPPLMRFKIHLRSDDTFQFSLTENHAITDGWSTTSTFSEIFSLCFSLLYDEASPAEPPIGTTFRDFVLMERMALESEEHRNYWHNKLAGLTPTKVPRWPTTSRPASARRIRRMDFAIPDDVFEGLKQLGRLTAVPFKAVVLAAHLKALTIISGQTDVVTGIVSNGRPEVSDGHRVRGLFLNTLPLRFQLNKGTWVDLVRETFDAEREFMPYRRYPYAALQKRWGRPPLYEVSFNYLQFHSVEKLARSGRLEFLPEDNIEAAETNFVLSITFFSSPVVSKLGLIMEYDTSELCEEQAHAFAGYYQKVLAAMVADPLARHDLRHFLSEQEQHQILGEWNDTKVEYELGHCLHNLFEVQVSRTPGSIAVSFEDDHVTYSELDRRANRLAFLLQESGVEPESFVGICAERSIEMVIAIFGVLKAGAAYVPIDPEYPAQRIAYMLEDIQAVMLLTQRRLLEQVVRPESIQCKVILLDRDSDTLSEETVEAPVTTVTQDNAAYAIYTSGSTGAPKGTIISHRSICNQMFWFNEHFHVSEQDRMLQKTAFSFDGSTWEFFAPLLAGGRVVMARPGGHRDAAYVAEVTAKEEITMLEFVPSMMRLFLEEEGAKECRNLRQVACGGEALPFSTHERFFEVMSTTELTNLYGPTETTVNATYWACRPGGIGGIVPIGRPIANAQMYVLDRFLQPTPVGVPGELHISGVQLARGYHRRPELTAEKFIPNPFSDEPGSRIYKTGDLVSYLSDGSIEYLGRIDNQVKVRGLRVEMGEIEAVLSSHGGVKEVVVAARESEDGLNRLVAYILPHDGQEPSVSVLREHLRQKLPEYMVPSSYVTMKSFPLTQNGKVDRKALPEPSTARPELQQAYAEPRTEAEQVIAGVWKQVLRLDAVGVNDNFFDLGGDSIFLLQIFNKLRNAFGKGFSVVDLFQYPTVGTLASYLTHGSQESPGQLAEDRAKKQRDAINRQRQVVMGSRAGND